MYRFGIVAVGFALVLSTSCRAQAPVSSTRAQAPVSSAATGASATSTVAPAAATGTSGTPTQIVLAEALSTAIALAAPFGVITGTVGPLRAGAAPCFADRYPCAVYAFSLPHEGSIEVTVKWVGDARALMAQLYWAGEGLAHEDVAPRNGPARIWFQRPKMEAADYRLRVVSLEPGIAIPFTLTLMY